VELRLTEELWAARCVNEVWEVAGSSQLGRNDSLLSILLDVDSSLIRESLGLPCGTLDLDLAEAFDSIAQPEIFCNLSERACLDPEDIGVLAAMIFHTRYVVVHKEKKSAPVPSTVGVPEGRTLSSATFAAAAAGLAALPHGSYLGVGLNPPLEAVTSFLLDQGTNDRLPPNTQLCEQLYEQLQRGHLQWKTLMNKLQHTADKLCMLDIASTVRVGITMYLDDTKAKGSSWGALCGVAEQLTKAIGRIRGEVKLGVGQDFIQSPGLQHYV